MCRSKKDGRKGGGHQGTRSKWREAKDRRRARTARHAARELILREFEDAAQAAESELQQDYFDSWAEEDDWSWTDNLIEPASPYDDDWVGVDWASGQDWTAWIASDYGEKPEPRDSELFLAVDRAVRRHGLEKTRQQAHILAAALDVSVWEIEACLNYTREGYIRRAL
jgi:GNAT superfamily N-acetyltransferase